MINYHITPQFKTNTLFKSYRFQIAKEKRSEVAMLARFFQYGIAEYPSKRELKKQLEMLYNVQFATGVERDGTYLILTFTLTFPEYRFVNADSVFPKVIELFQQLTESPYFMEAEDFSAEFNQEKQLLIEQIKSVYDDKTQYAFTQLQTRLLRSTPYFEDITGTEKMVESTTLEAVRECWKKIHKDAQIDMYATVAKEETRQKLQSYFTGDLQVAEPTCENNAEVEFPTFSDEEVQQVTQAKINFAVKSGITLQSQDYFASLIATAILGGGSQSKLFQNVREKQSLAYYANAIADSNSGMMYIYSGVNIDKIAEATTCIFEQIDAMKNGDVSDDELTLTKKVMINSLQESLNRPMGIIQFDRKLKKHPNISDFTAYINSISSITKEEVIAVAQKWEKCGSFVLKGDE